MWGQLTNGAVIEIISAVIAAAAFAGGLNCCRHKYAARCQAGDRCTPQSTPATQTAPALAAAAISPALVRLDEVVRDLAVVRNRVEQFAAKQEQMAQTIATLQATEQQAAEQDVIQTTSSPPQPVSPPARKKARRPPKLAAHSSSVPHPAFRPDRA